MPNIRQVDFHFGNALLAQIALFFRSPSLEALLVGSINSCIHEPDTLEEDLRSTARRSCTVMDLCIRECDYAYDYAHPSMRLSILEAFLGIFAYFQRFQWVCRDPDVLTSGWSEMLADIIAPFKATLRILDLEICCYPLQQTSDRILEPLLDLRQSQELRTIRIAPELLMRCHNPAQMSVTPLNLTNLVAHSRPFSTVCNLLPKSLMALSLIEFSELNTVSQREGKDHYER